MPSNTYTTDSYTYTTDWHSGSVMSITLGDRTFNRVQILNLLKYSRVPYTHPLHALDYPYLEKDIDKIVTAIVLARLDGAL